MKFEVKKLISVRWFTVLFVIFLVLNLTFFSCKCISMKSVADIYDLPLEQIHELSESAQETDSTDLINFRIENPYKVALNEIIQQEQYHEWLESYLTEMKTKAESGMFGDESSHAVKELNRGFRIYQKLEDINPKKQYYGNAEILLNWNGSFLFSMCLTFISALLLFYDEKKNGINKLLKTTTGFTNLYRNKQRSVVMIGIVFHLICFLLQYMIVSCILGMPVLNEPIQGVAGFQMFPYRLSIGACIVFNLLWSIFVLVCSAQIICFLNAVFTSIINICAAVSGYLFIQFLLYQSTAIWIHTASIFGWCNFTDFYNHSYVLWLFECMISEHHAIIISESLISLVLYMKGKEFFARNSITQSDTIHYHLAGRAYVSLGLVEWKKLIISSFGLLLILTCTTAELTHNVVSKLYPSPEQYAYRNYSAVLDGQKTEAKAEYIATEKQRLTARREEGKEEPVNEKGLERAEQHYQSLDDTDRYVYEDGYYALFQKQGMNYILTSMMIGLFTYIMAFSVYTAQDYESGVYILQNTYGVYPKVRSVKRRHTLIFSAVISVITLLPRIVYIHDVFGIYSIF